MTLVFVYGTLKRGGTNHHHLAGQEFVAPARTLPRYRLHRVSDYPGLVAAADATTGITGEVWSVDDDCLAELDRFEGTDQGLYRRERVLLDGAFPDAQVQAYFYLKDVSECPDCGPTWPV
jgi:gamma-glutamylcyclotransferase (GGCT)/AIG2-like uncharacterized protein YtfP